MTGELEIDTGAEVSALRSKPPPKHPPPPIPLVTVPQAVDLTALLYCVDWWNARWFHSDSSVHLILICPM